MCDIFTPPRACNLLQHRSRRATASDVALSPALPTPRTLLTRPRRTHKHGKMQLSGLVFLLLGSAACFDIDIAPPKLGLRRLFRRPYRGPICVIEIIGAELTPIANSGTARSHTLCPPAPQLAPVAALSLWTSLLAAPKIRCEAQMPLASARVRSDTQVASTGAVPSA